jgi:hypothetical protein
VCDTIVCDAQRGKEIIHMKLLSMPSMILLSIEGKEREDKKGRKVRGCKRLMKLIECHFEDRFRPARAFISLKKSHREREVDVSSSQSVYMRLSSQQCRMVKLIISACGH